MIQEIINSDMVEIQARAINKSFAIDQSFGLICLENTIELFEVFVQHPPALHVSHGEFRKYRTREAFWIIILEN